jgi:hypothetical protein
MDHELIAHRLVNELMLVSVLVAGEGAGAFAQALAAAGAAAEVFAGGPPHGGDDLAILLAGQDAAADDSAKDLVGMLSQASERLLFVPLPPPLDTDGPATAALPELTMWFEVFAELGYQPVVDFDAGFVAQGAFLVDRAATAAESELAAFADRLQNPPSPAAAEPPAMPNPALQAELSALRDRLAEQETRLAELSARTEDADAALSEAQSRNAGWDGLRAWVNAAVRAPSRDTEVALLRDLPRLKALRGAEAPPIDLLPPSPAPTPERGFFSRIFRRPTRPGAPVVPLRVLEETALVRASDYFDPSWYIASSPELCAGETIDPVFHYVFVGALRGADPGPWFDTAAYLAEHPEAAGAGLCALAHALRAGTLAPHPEAQVAA